MKFELLNYHKAFGLHLNYVPCEYITVRQVIIPSTYHHYGWSEVILL